MLEVELAGRRPVLAGICIAMASSMLVAVIGRARPTFVLRDAPVEALALAHAIEKPQMRIGLPAGKSHRPRIAEESGTADGQFTSAFALSTVLEGGAPHEKCLGLSASRVSESKQLLLGFDPVRLLAGQCVHSKRS